MTLTLGICLLSPQAVWAQSLACDVPQFGEISTLGEVDEYSLSLPSGGLISMAVGTPPGGARVAWRVLDSEGNPAPDCGVWGLGGGAGAGLRDCDLPASAEPYVVQLHDSGDDDTGPYEISFRFLADAEACAQGSLECGVVVPEVLDSITASDLFSFTVADGERVELIVERTPGQPSARMRVLNQDGTPAPDCGDWDVVYGRDCSLPASGNPYRMQVTGNGLLAAVGVYSAHLARLDPVLACDDVSPIDCDVPVTGSLGDGDADFLTFEVDDGEVLRFQVKEDIPAGYEPRWRILDAQDQPAADCGSYRTRESVDCGPLPASGNPYRFQIRNSTLAGGVGYAAYYHSLNHGSECEVTAITCGGGPINGTIEHPLDSDLLRFAVADQQLWSISVLGTSGDLTPGWRLLQGDGTPAAHRGDWSTAFQATIFSLPSSGNVYRIEIADFYAADTGTYSVELTQCTPLAADQSIARATRLLPPIPNPFNPRTRLHFELETAGRVELAVYDGAGRHVRTLENGWLGVGPHERSWDGRDKGGDPVATGVYFARFAVDGEVRGSLQKMVLIK